MRTVRGRLLKIQRLAAARATASDCADAAGIFWLVCDLAGRCANANVPLDRLEEDRRHLISLILAGNNIEMLERAS